MKEDLNNNLMIAVVLNLFVLSMISERLVNFLKLNFQKIYTTKLLPNILKGFLKEIFGNFRDKEHSKKSEKERERGVLNWAIFASLIVAFASKADLFYMIKCGELSTDINYDKINYVGIVLTALFLSLGSKFWHDLLDVLYFYKNAKQKLNDKNIDSFDNADALEEFVKLPYSKIYENIVSQYPQYFANSNILYTLNGIDKAGSEDIQCIVVHVKTKENFVIPEYLKYQLPNTKSSINVKVIVVEDTLPKINTTVSNGMGIKKSGFPSLGTIGCIFIDEDGIKYAITCNHVLNNGSMNSLGGGISSPIENDTLLSTRNGINSGIIGTLVYGLCNSYLDIALVKLNDSVNISLTTKLSETIYTLHDIDVKKQKIAMQGLMSQYKEGVIVSYNNNSIDFDYVDGSHSLNYLIAIGAGSAQDFDYKNSQPISVKGDSGALIYNVETKQPIGLVVGASDRYTFAIPLSDIVSKVNSNFKKLNIHIQ